MFKVIINTLSLKNISLILTLNGYFSHQLLGYSPQKEIKMEIIQTSLMYGAECNIVIKVSQIMKFV